MVSSVESGTNQSQAAPSIVYEGVKTTVAALTSLGFVFPAFKWKTLRQVGMPMDWRNPYKGFAPFALGGVTPYVWSSLFVNTLMERRYRSENQGLPLSRFQHAKCAAAASVTGAFFLHGGEALMIPLQTGSGSPRAFFAKHGVFGSVMRLAKYIELTIFREGIFLGGYLMGRGEINERLTQAGFQGRVGELSTSLISDSMAGGLSGAASTPVDVIKTMLQDQIGSGNIKFKNSMDAVRYVWSQNGLRGFGRGIGARISIGCSFGLGIRIASIGFDRLIAKMNKE